MTELSIVQHRGYRLRAYLRTNYIEDSRVQGDFDRDLGFGGSGIALFVDMLFGPGSGVRELLLLVAFCAAAAGVSFG